MVKINVKSLSKWAFLTGIFLLPLVFWPKAYIPYEIPKVWFFQRWVEVLGILALLRSVKPNFGRVKDVSILVFLPMVFVLIGIISSIFGVNFVKSFVGNYYRMDGVLTLLHLAALFFFVVLFWEEEWKKGMALAIAAGSLTASFWTILSGTPGQFGATFGNPNFLAGYLLVSLPFTVFALREKRIIGKIGIIGVIVAIILTGSTAGMIGILLLGVGYLFLGLKDKRKLVLVGAVGIISCLCILSYLSHLSKTEAFFPESRQRIIVRGFNGFLKRPILGWGVANFDYAFESNYWPIKFNNDVYVDKAHSNILEVLVTGGIVGFGVYAGIIFLVFRGLLKDFKGDIRGDLKGKLGWKITLLFSFLLFLFHSQTNIISINEEMIFWLIAGIIGSQNGLLIEAESDKIDQHEINKTGS